MAVPVRVWDLPTRLFHWALVACVTGLITTAQLGGNAMLWHFQLGYLMLSLLMFRIAWGWLGGHWSRFASFWFTPATVWRYVTQKTPAKSTIGHNPLGALSVFALLTMLLLQVSSGLMSDDQVSNAGPLSRFVPDYVSASATHYHKNIGTYTLSTLVVFHIGAIFFHLIKNRENLVSPMFNGDKHLAVPVTPARDDTQTRLMALLVFVSMVAATQGLAYLLT